MLIDSTGNVIYSETTIGNGWVVKLKFREHGEGKYRHKKWWVTAKHPTKKRRQTTFTLNKDLAQQEYENMILGCKKDEN